MKTTDKPTLQDFHIEGAKHIAPEDALELLKNNDALLIDVREDDETNLESVPLTNVLYHPISVIQERLAFIPKNKKIIVACPMGICSTKVANILNENGFTNVANLYGGFTLWKAKGLPWESNVSFGGGCSCGGSCG